MKRIIILFAISVLLSSYSLCRTQEIYLLADRVTEGSAKDRIDFKLTECDTAGIDWFSIDSTEDGKVLIEGDNLISLAVGLNYYLKYVAGIHISWNNLTQKLPDSLPLPNEKILRKTGLKDRYYLNYCTFSYSMPFWDEDRWMKEIDWMALHGINMALSMTGIETVWKNILLKKGYSFDEICEFIPGPAYMAWWQMNNLTGWGGPLTEEWFVRQENLQKGIVERMKSLGISPVLPGYSGLVPKDFDRKTGMAIEDIGIWCGFDRPGFLSPENVRFDEMADLYYEELTNLYGESNHYSMDPFHEGGVTGDIDLEKVGKSLYGAMKRANPNAKWVIQSWQANPRKKMIDSLPAGDLIVLDLYSEKIPKWEQIGGYGDHDWLYCMLLNFGGNIGMHGRMKSLIDGFYRASNGEYARSFSGIGATPEGIENNPVMYELLFELPWEGDSLDVDRWLGSYLSARYGQDVGKPLLDAWRILCNTVYNAPVDYRGEGTVESLICARPSWNPRSASTWGNSELFYSPDSTAKAAELFSSVYDRYKDNRNFIYDYVDVQRQANADEANRMINKMSELKEDNERDSLIFYSDQFLNLLLRQDSLLSSIPEMTVDKWINDAEAAAGDDPDARKLFKLNACMLVTVWGDSVAANSGGLHDYSHREWSGLIKELYYPRWKAFFDYELHGAPDPDFYQMEKEWIRRRVED